ncbi:MAG: mercuric reductase [Elusimicrobia bacterium CG11_big_fil_rev_8_21_14_0_20_64_6]|nr:MAG: mercuric reductase [Elusimicrobia bacterium CG11_big_fil_rev_8_21_14_0_20_64_6]
MALIERHLMGGDCLNAGCVPSKALIGASRAAAQVRDTGAFGVKVPDGVTVDFPAVMERLRRLRADISKNDSAACFKSLGVDVFVGQGRFTGSGTVEVGGKTLRFAKAVIATGARAVTLPIPGLKESGALTNETVFSLTELPKRLLVIGAGPIGVELAQAFARLGSQVTLFEAMHGLLTKEDQDAADIVRKSLARDKVDFLCCVDIEKVERTGGVSSVRFKSKHGSAGTKEFDAILVGAGRAPNIEGLALDAVGVKVDDHLRTTNPNIYAAGDICLAAKFTHTADFAARIVIQNALFFGRKRFSALTIPWCTYTDPEIAHVGLYEKEALERGLKVRTFIQKFEEVDRAILDGESEGFVKIMVEEGSDKILGATIVAAHAGDIISEISVAMNNGVGLPGIGTTIHPYPTQAEAIRKLGDAYNRTRLTPFAKSALSAVLKWRR